MKNLLTMDYPASWWVSQWREAIPAGNGKIGAAVYGMVREETILINHEDLWANCRSQQLPNVSEKLTEVRKLLLEGKIVESEHILINALKEQGFKASRAVPMPVGDIKLRMSETQAFKEYRRELNMENGEVKVTWMERDIRFDRVMFVSRPDDLIAYEIRSSGKHSIYADFWLDLHEKMDAFKPFGKESASLPEEVEILSEGQFIYYSARNTDGSDFGMVARVETTGGNISSLNGKTQIEGADKVKIYVKVFIKDERRKAWKTLKRELSNISRSYEELLESHSKEHGRLFHSASLDLKVNEEEYLLSNEELLLKAYKGEAPAVLMEKMWAYGRYLLISSSHDGGQPCHLIGLWCGEYNAFWAINMANENLQVIYWQVLSGNMPELLLPVFDYYDGMIEDFKINAKNLYGCRGIFVPAVTTPGEGLIQCLSPHIVHWTGGAGWVAQHYFDYYLYTQDEEFLRNRALPFMREAALFYRDFFIMGEDGYYISIPSQSPENTPGNYLEEGKDDGIKTTINATMDFAIAKEILTKLIKASEITGLYIDEIKNWEEMLKHIPPYHINKEGAVCEWMYPLFKDNYKHRHLSHIYPIFPGYEVTMEEKPELFEAFAKAVRLRHTLGLNYQTSWSLVHMASSYARMEEGDGAAQCLDEISRSCLLNNLYTLHNDWRKMGIGTEFRIAPFQIDGNMGWTGAVNEMLLFAKPGIVKLLPALPKRWRKGSVSGLLCRGGIKVSIEWDMLNGWLKARLVSKIDQNIRIKVPGVIREISIKSAQYQCFNGKFVEGVKLEAGTEVGLEVIF